MRNNDLYTQGAYLEKNPTWHVEDSPWKAHQVLTMVQRNKLQLSSICEIGCGAGEILNQLHQKMPENIQFTGYEISPQAFALSQQRAADRLQFRLGSVDDDRFYDLALIIDVVEHIEDYYGFLRSAHSAATYKMFIVPLDMSVNSVLRGSPLLRVRKQYGHIQYFTPTTLKASLEDTGHEIVDIFYNQPLDFPTPKLEIASLRRIAYVLGQKVLHRLSPDLAARILGNSVVILTK